MKKLALLSFFPLTVLSKELPPFIDTDFIQNAEFKCLNSLPKVDENEEKFVKKLWNETLTYLEGYATALSTSTNNLCYKSDLAMTETYSKETGKEVKQCIMDNVDMQKLVKHIYTIIHNPEKAYQCFNPQKNVAGLYSPSSEVKEISEVAKWLNRSTLKNYFENQTIDPIKRNGIKFSENFYQMITGKDLTMPNNFPFDISANALPNLWASVGWIPMYSGSDLRSVNAGDEHFRGGYAYGEIMGHWGLLQIDTINNEPVGAEIGMTVQAMNTFYPYHFHNIPEIYYTIKEPKCENSIQQFVLGKNSSELNTVDESKKTRSLEFNSIFSKDINKYWCSTTPKKDPLLYIPRNSIHAFDLTQQCENNSKGSAHITIWARSTANEKNNDYGTTLLCELKDESLPKNKINDRNVDVICKQNIHIY